MIPFLRQIAEQQVTAPASTRADPVLGVDPINRRRLLVGGTGAALAGLATALPLPTYAAAPFVSRRIAVRVRGAGPDVLLVPGLASGPGIWNALVSAIPGVRWHLVQLRGFADLPPDLNARGPVLRPVADEIARYAATLPGRPALIGHSMGGTLGLMIASSRPLLLRRLMVVDMLPDGSEMLGGTAAGLGYLAAQLNGYLTGTKAGRQILADMVSRSPGAKGSDPAVISQSLADIAMLDLTPALSRLRVPLDVAYALPSDRKAAAAQTARYRHAYKSASERIMSGIGPSGHMIMLDQPQRFAAAVKNFLTRRG